MPAIRTHTQIAKILTDRGMPISRAQVWVIERRAINKLRDSLKEFYERNFLADD